MVLSQFSGPVNIFVSLAPQDKKLFEKLRRHLSVLKQQGFIHTLRDSLIAAESDVIDNVASYIRDANIIVLLISANFFASEQCVNVEMPCALEQQEAGDAHIIPVLLRPIASLASPLDRYTLLPPNGKAVSIWSNVDAALAEVVKGISRVIQKLTRRLTGTPTPVKPPQFPLSTLAVMSS